MIHDQLSRSGLYESMHRNFRRAFSYLRDFDPATPDGRVEIDGDALFALPQSFETEPAAQRRFEAHRRYIDIQYVLLGEETIRCCNAASLEVSEPYNEARDVMFFCDFPDASSSVLRPGDFTIYFPHDAHKPCCQHTGPVQVRKVVVKVAV